ncbi:hypothetical protein DDF62_21340 [Caulobacter radicis]|uniref:hypothetical protein n=1 Tax=Caulobacter radicis TaxID=2172650 RepID=UPI000D566419|nr:hypothetical protein [Caulobacter radicis]PVM85074.1 hypothetical protein DDF62_21340 [Caulobacter radicis]
MIKGGGLAIAIIMGALAAAPPVGAASDPARGSGYFPPEFRKPSILCPIFRRQPVISEVEAEWYPRILMAADEPSLYALSRQSRPPGVRTYRLTFIPTFHKPMIVRLNRWSTGETELVATRLSGAGGYDPGLPEENAGGVVRRVLSKDEERRFEHLLKAASNLNRSSADCRLGTDGSQWILESASGGTYRYVNRWSPERGDERALGEFMLGLAGWRPPRGY